MYGLRKPIGKSRVETRHPLGRDLLICPVLNNGYEQLWDAALGQPWLQYQGENLGHVNLAGPLWTQALSSSGFVAYPGEEGDPCLQGNDRFRNFEISMDGIPAFQNVPAGFSFAILFRPDDTTTVGYLTDTNNNALFTGYVNIGGAGTWRIQPPVKANNQANAAVDTAFSVGDWIFAHCTVAPNNSSIYRNGVQLTNYVDVNIANTWKLNYHRFTIACADTGVGTTRQNYYAGKLAGFWAWSRALTAAEVTAHVASPFGMLHSEIYTQFWSLGPIAYSEPNRSVNIKAVEGRTDQLTITELGKSVSVIVSLGKTDLLAFTELGKAIPVKATEGETDHGSFSEIGKAVAIISTIHESDVQAMLESGRAVGIVTILGETDQINGFTDLGRQFGPVIAVSGESDSLGIFENLAGSVIALMAQSDILAMLDSDKGVIVRLSTGETDVESVVHVFVLLRSNRPSDYLVSTRLKN
jgi:hypothetical protein